MPNNLSRPREPNLTAELDLHTLLSLLLLFLANLINGQCVVGTWGFVCVCVRACVCVCVCVYVCVCVSVSASLLRCSLQLLLTCLVFDVLVCLHFLNYSSNSWCFSNFFVTR